MTDQQQIETVKAIARQVNSIVRDFRDMEAERDRALATLQRVRNLHKRQVDDDGLFCRHCCESWPCMTIRALDDKEQS